MHIPCNPMRAVGALLLCLALLMPAEATEASTGPGIDNAGLVRAAFDDWRHGRGSVFDLLADDAEWTVAGSSPVSGAYRGRQAFMQNAVAPINARLSTPIVPTVRHLVAQGDEVVVIWDGTATAQDGGAYVNSYAWHLVLDEGRIVRVTAFLDTWALNELMR